MTRRGFTLLEVMIAIAVLAMIGGLTEEASIHVSQGGDVYSLLVSPLTGRVKVVGEREDAPGQRR